MHFATHLSLCPRNTLRVPQSTMLNWKLRELYCPGCSCQHSWCFRWSGKGWKYFTSSHILPLQRDFFLCKVFIFALRVLTGAMLNVGHGLLAVYGKICWSRKTRTRASGLAVGNGRWQKIQAANRNVWVCEICSYVWAKQQVERGQYSRRAHTKLGGGHKPYLGVVSGGEKQSW